MSGDWYTEESGDLRLLPGNDVQANATAFSRAVVGTDASRPGIQ